MSLLALDEFRGQDGVVRVERFFLQATFEDDADDFAVALTAEW